MQLQFKNKKCIIEGYIVNFYLEDNGYLAVVPSLPGCSAVGDTFVETVKTISWFIPLWIDAQRSVGNPIPEKDWTNISVS